MRELFDHVERDRNQKNGDQGGAEHSTDNRGSKYLARNCAGTRGCPQRHATENECEGSHQNGPQTDAGADERGFLNAFAVLLVFALGKLDNQDSVLGCQSDQHDEADLGVDIVIEMSQPEKEISAEHGDGRAKQDAEGQRPAFILSGKDEEDEEERQPEDGAGGNALARPSVPERTCRYSHNPYSGAWSARTPLQRLHGLAGTVSGRGGGVDLGGFVFVVAHGELGAVGGLDVATELSGTMLPLLLAT